MLFIIRFLCPYGHRLAVPDHRAGKKGRCPECFQKVIIPAPNPQPQGSDGSPLNAGPGQPILLDPDLEAPLGFDKNRSFAEAAGRSQPPPR